MNLKTSILILLGLSGLIFFSFSSKNAACAAAVIADQTCDTQVWRTMENRARLETEREIMQNQNLIFKADSILNYTCFDRMTAHATATIGPIFTHNPDRWGGLIIPWQTGESMDVTLTWAVVNSMRTWLLSNFDHAYLGGRGEFLGLPPPMDGVLEEIPEAGEQLPAGEGSPCGIMAEVWRVAKCLNFVHNGDFALTDGYYPFIDIIAVEGDDVIGYANGEIEDVRKFPTECDGQPFMGSTWELMYRYSRNETGFGANDLYYQYGNPLRETFEEIRLMVEPAACADPIPTGVQVILGPESGDPYPDGVCTNPGCSYRRDETCSVAPPAGGAGGPEE